MAAAPDPVDAFVAASAMEVALRWLPPRWLGTGLWPLRAQEFADASKYVGAKRSLKLSDEDRLKLYGLFKQTTSGPCNTEKPGLFDPVGRAKWAAWKECARYNTPELAAAAYVALVDTLAPNWRDEFLEMDEGRQEEDEASGGAGMGGMGLGISRPQFAAEDVVADKDKSVFDWAIEGNVARVKAALARGHSLNQLDKEGRTVLHYAVDRLHEPLVRELIAARAALDVKDEEGMTALHYACLCEEPDLVKLLLRSGASPDVPDGDGQTARALLSAMPAPFAQLLGQGT